MIGMAAQFRKLHQLKNQPQGAEVEAEVEEEVNKIEEAEEAMGTVEASMEILAAILRKVICQKTTLHQRNIVAEAAGEVEVESLDFPCAIWIRILRCTKSREIHS